MKNQILKSVLIAGIALSPLMLSAQTKGGTASGAGPGSGTASGTSTGEAARPAAARERDAAKAGLKDSENNEGRMRNNTAMFDRLDADKDGSISREEFAKMGANRARPNKDRNNADRNSTDRTRPQAGDRSDRKNNPRTDDDTDAKKDTDVKKDTEVKDEDVKDTTTPSAEAATRTTGTTGGTGSSASGAGQSGSANSGTGVRPQ